MPLIDFAPFVGGSEPDKKNVARTIAEACESIGFFAIKGHGGKVAPAKAFRHLSLNFFAKEHPAIPAPITAIFFLRNFVFGFCFRLKVA